MPKTKQQPTAKQRRDEAEHRVATLTAQAEAVVLEKSLALMESPQPVVVPWTDYPMFDAFGGFPAYDRPYLWTQLDDRTEGRYRPLYETPQDLKRMRADARRLKALFPVAEGVMGTLDSYVMQGFEFTVQPKQKNAPPEVQQLATEVQGAVDRFLEYNSFVDGLDKQIHVDSRVEGEQFVALYPEGQNVRAEVIDADCIVEPLEKRQLERMLRCQHKLSYWWHGVHTHHNQQLKRDDCCRPLGYHAVFDSTGEQWDYLPASRVEHIKRNVGHEARRGWSDFGIVLKDLEAEAKIRRNTAEGAAILAAIVMIRTHAEGASKSSIERMVSDSATSSYDRLTPNGTRSTNSENVRPGTIRDNPAGMTSELGPMGTLRSPVYIEVAQYLGRIIGRPWQMPEFLITGDASNANYASTLVAESPFVKYCEGQQAFYARHYERLIWKSLRMSCELHAIAASWQQVCQLLDITIGYTSPASRDKLQQAQVNQILSDSKVMSKRTWASDSGLDYDEEQEEIATQPAEPAPQPFGGGFTSGGLDQFSDVPGVMQRRAAYQRSESRLESLAAAALKRLTE